MAIYAINEIDIDKYWDMLQSHCIVFHAHQVVVYVGIFHNWSLDVCFFKTLSMAVIHCCKCLLKPGH